MYYYVYILVSDNRQKWSYVGQTDNIKRRLKEHNNGKVKSTKALRPLRLIYTEKYYLREESLKREKYLKSGYGREEKQNIISYSGIV